MISFRFHVVSITAVFLAIAIGVLVGSTYVDRAIVDNLQNRVETVSHNLDARKAENDALERSLSEAGAYTTASADYAVTERLAEVPVLIVAARGIDESAVAETVRLARQAGGAVPGVVWLEPQWSLIEDGDRAALAALVDGRFAAELDQLRGAAWRAVADELVEPRPPAEMPPVATDAATTTTVAPDSPGAPVLLGLVDAGFLTFDALDDDSTSLAALAGSGARVLVLTGPEAAEEVVPVVSVVVGASLEAGTVAAEVFAPTTDGPERGQMLSDSLDQDTRDVLAIVDDADRTEGQVAAVLALAGAPGEIVGHFGYGPGADAVLPAWSPL